MPVINNVTVPDQYDGKTAILQNCRHSRGGWFSVSQNPVFVELQYDKTSQQQGEEDWTQEILLGVGAFATLPTWCIGVQFRNAVPGSKGIITAQIAIGDEPPLQISALGSVITSGKAPTQTILTTTGSGTYNTPANCVAILVECWGGGGSGGFATGTGATTSSAGGGGGGGGYAAIIIPAPASSFPFTVGAGGPVSGGNGQATNFGAGPSVNANGGLQGTTGPAATTPGGGGAGSAGGSGTVGTTKITGGSGQSGMAGGNIFPIGGAGGDSPRGGPGANSASNNSTGTAAGNTGQNPGGGGGGAANWINQGTGNPGAGGNGQITVTEFY